MPPCRSRRTSLCKNRFDTLPEDVLLAIFTRCDAVTVTRCSRVCTVFRRIIQSDRLRQETQLLPCSGPARLFIPDRRRAILERIIKDDDDMSEGTVSLSSSPPTTRGPTERSISHSTVRSVSSSHSMQELLGSLHENPRKSFRQRLTPKELRFEQDQMASTNESAWAYKFDLKKWKEVYEINEVCLQNVGSFLERDKGRMADPPSSSSTYHSQTTPHAYTGHHSSPPEGIKYGGSMYGMSNGGPPSRYHSLSSSKRVEEKTTTINELNDEMRSELRVLSSGRFERLASQLSDINPLHIVFRDLTLYQKRPVGLILWLIENLQRSTSVRRVTFDGIQGNDKIRLEGGLSLKGIEHLTVRQPPQSAAIIVNEEILLSWLRLPSSQREILRARFHGCRRLSPRGMCRFIREWQLNAEVAVFEAIVVDEDSMHPWEFVEEAEKDEKRYEREDDYLRPRKRDLPAYLTSENETRTDEERQSLRRTMEFRHKKGGHAITYYYEDGLLIFSCTLSSSRPYSPPTCSSSSHLLIPSTRPSSSHSFSSSRLGSLPRDSTLSSSLPIHSFHNPPSSPGMFGRLIQILRSNA